MPSVKIDSSITCPSWSSSISILKSKSLLSFLYFTRANFALKIPESFNLSLLEYQGVQGDQGQSGLNGSQFHIGEGPPLAIYLEKPNGISQYFDTLNNLIWWKYPSAWVPIKHIKGPNGGEVKLNIKSVKHNNQLLTASGYYIPLSNLVFDLPLSMGYKMGFHKLIFKVVSQSAMDGVVSFATSLNGSIISITTKLVPAYSSITITDFVNLLLVTGPKNYSIVCKVDPGLIIMGDLISLKVIY